MKALSLWQPWASAIFATDEVGLPLKPDETRDWPTKVRGRIAIHAAKRGISMGEGMRLNLILHATLGSSNPHSILPFGAIVGTVELVDCVKTESLVYARPIWQLQWGDYGPRRFAFIFKNPMILEEPIKCTGRQGFFNISDDLLPPSHISGKFLTSKDVEVMTGSNGEPFFVRKQ